MRAITFFQSNQVGPAYDHPRPDRLVSTHNPLRTTWEYYARAGVSAGIWACEPGCWKIRFADNKDEFFCVIEGLVRLHDEAGVIVEIGPGQAAVIPAGFIGMFEVVVAVKKYFVVTETSAAIEP
jgi:uncharacterized protein